MSNWPQLFDAFMIDFDAYLADFPEIGWHERYIVRYREATCARDGTEVAKLTKEEFEVLNSAVRLLLDGRQKLSVAQREKVKTLTRRWVSLQRSFGTAPITKGHSIGFDPKIYVR